MSIPPQPPTQSTQGFQPAELGGGLVIAQPLPSETPFPLRPAEFLSLCDGDSSAISSLRDIGIGALVTGVLAAASQLSNWDTAIKQNAHFLLWTIVILMVTAAALACTIIGFFVTAKMKQQSAYARQVVTIAAYFKMEDHGHALLVRLFRKKKPAPTPAQTNAAL